MATKSNITVNKTFDFTVNIAALYKKLKQERECQIGNQLFRSAGSMGANVEAAQAAQSRKDFISKLSIASREADEIINILTKIIKTTSETKSPLAGVSRGII